MTQLFGLRLLDLLSRKGVVLAKYLSLCNFYSLVDKAVTEQKHLDGRLRSKIEQSVLNCRRCNAAILVRIRYYDV